ncbi:4-hydroxy-tetrahydrodipicolinate synthase family protein [Microbispora bryophytorum]|uniref:4-hydroxy-tetrahydrodipicolinate synthase n=1 Tax=Microbispora bryophytorum TaxID=1460882 RepID=A0A8H9LH23_9ACTN|nr:4-hydroxy-tetrahydrodipicolinate synthase [Microbispora bryophytorum]MBD3140511.1 4-hydroxy-tetrahydrodipicolinate synthase [Microbispora bryophytorum]TQS01784.1 4-hydroxy-tetrahydrodipicolinate synthase [Microbispora bryophytorum]GGO30091.1 4-hydroxy-tetrahydrodipicolinate synthase 2 [Microbispora bryophytorum]
MTLSGIHVPLITPFAADGEIAFDALEDLARAALDDGASGLVALGTTAEVATLAEEERRAVIEICGRVCRERGATLTVGAGSADTRSTAEALRALKGEADAALVTVPAFVRPSEAGVLAHFTALAEQTPVPLVVYNIPYRTGQSVGAATLRRLGELPMVAGVKHAVGGVDLDTVALLADPPEGFAVLAGDDPFLSALLALGASGGILASAHLRTGEFAELFRAWRAGEVEHARALGHRLSLMSAAMFAEPNPTVLKGVLHAQGRIPTADVRLPLVPASRASVEAALRML